MEVLVTGGTGFVGSHLVRRLLSHGDRVRTLDKNPGLFDGELRDLGAELVTGSVSDADTVDRSVAGCDLVYHLASPFGDILQPDSVYWDVEVTGTRNVLESAERHRVKRVVHCSTQGVHGSLAETPGDEDSALSPQDYYCYSKVEGERVCQEFLARGMDIVIVRPTSVYGPGDTRGWLKLYRMVARGWFPMIGNGRTLNHPVYAENLAELFELAATTPEAKGRVYLAGDEQPVTLSELVRGVAEALGTEVRIIGFPWYGAARIGASVVETVSKTIGMKPPVFPRRLSWYKTNRAFRIDRAKDELGYRPKISLREGLARTAEWYRSAGYLDAPGHTNNGRSASARPMQPSPLVPGDVMGPEGWKEELHESRDISGSRFR
jgi:nucleoside-diphosphate-sugar epimerase